MIQASLFDRPSPFGGKTITAVHDHERLASLFARVFTLMADGRWRTFAEIKAVTGGSEAGISARLRDCRKPRFGGYVVNSRRRGNPKEGCWEYQLVV